MWKQSVFNAKSNCEPKFPSNKNTKSIHLNCTCWPLLHATQAKCTYYTSQGCEYNSNLYSFWITNELNPKHMTNRENMHVHSKTGLKDSKMNQRLICFHHCMQDTVVYLCLQWSYKILPSQNQEYYHIKCKLSKYIRTIRTSTEPF